MQLIQSLIELQERYDNFEDTMVMLKVLMNYRDAWRKILGGNGGLLFLLKMEKETENIFHDLYARGTKDDLKTLEEKFFIYSLRELTYFDILPDEINYQFFKQSWVDEKVRLTKRYIWGDK